MPQLVSRSSGGRVIEMSQHEYALRGRGYLESKEDLELAVVGTDDRGTPIRIRDVAEVTIGGNIRRGLVDLDGRGEVVAGIVIMRSGQNALDVVAILALSRATYRKMIQNLLWATGYRAIGSS